MAWIKSSVLNRIIKLKPNEHNIKRNIIEWNITKMEIIIKIVLFRYYSIIVFINISDQLLFFYFSSNFVVFLSFVVVIVLYIYYVLVL